MAAGLSIDPPQGYFIPGQAGQSHHNILNVGSVPVAVKIKCSDNNLYRLRPVYSLIPPTAAVELAVARLEGPAKQDKLVIQFIPVPNGGLVGVGDSGVSDAFKQAAVNTVQQIIFPLVAAEQAPPESKPPEAVTQQELDAYNQQQQQFIAVPPPQQQQQHQYPCFASPPDQQYQQQQSQQ